MGAVWYRFRAELRARWRAWAALALLVGIAGAAALTLAAGARRTDSAYPRFARWARAVDAGAGCTVPADGADGAACDPGRLRRLPQVAGAGSAIEWGPGSVIVETADGRPVQPDAHDPGYTGPGELNVLAPVDREFGTLVQRMKLLDGRPPRSDRASEAAVNYALADRLELRIGDRLRLSFPSEEDDGRILLRQTVRIVGIEVAPLEIPPPSGHWFAGIHVSSAFGRREVARALPHGEFIAIRLRDGATVAQLQRAAARRDLPFRIQDFAEIGAAENVRRAIRPHATALWIVAALVALGAAAILGQALARTVVLDTAENDTLSALGLSRRDLRMLALVRAGFIAGIATIVAVVASLVASPLMPIGLARTIEPDPGVSVDATMVLLGALFTIALVTLAIGMATWRAANSARTVSRQRPSLVATVSGRASLRPVAAMGVRFALEPGRGRVSVPVRSTLAGVTAGLIAVAAALTFSGSLDRLVSTPRLSGWNWTVATAVPYVDDGQGGTTPIVPFAKLESAFASHPLVDGVAFGTYFRPFPTQDHALELGQARVPVDILTFAPGRVGPTVLRGDAPLAADEILVGPDVLEDLGLDVGDTVRAIGRVGEFEDPSGLREVSARFRIVGVGVVPLSGGTTRVGRGATLTLTGVQTMNPDALPDVVWLRLASGANPAAVAREVGRTLGVPSRTVTQFIGFQQSNEVLNVAQVDELPLLLAGILGFLAAGVLAHVLLTGVRARRRDLAILRTLGFVRRQIRATVAIQATTLAVLAAAVGLPLGVILGRVIWREYSESIGVLPETAVPIALLAAVALTTLLVSNLIAMLPARSAARMHPALVLRSE